MNAANLSLPAYARYAQELFGFAGSVLRIETNSSAVLSAARSVFTASPAERAPRFDFNLFVAPASSSAVREPAWPQPYFRGRDHLVIAVYGGGAILFDLLGRRAIGLFSEAMASDQHYWRRVIFPVAVGVISASLGVVPLHCAALVRHGRALLISGLSGAGKSTLAMALAQRGFSLLSDDWTYFALRQGRPCAYGLPVPIKLMPDAQRFFPELQTLTPTMSLNGELAFELDPAAPFSPPRVYSCTPERIVFLSRRHDAARPHWVRLAPAQVESQFSPALERIPDCLRSARRTQHRIISRLSAIDAYSLLCSGSPRQIAEEIDRFVNSKTPSVEQDPAGLPAHFEIPDLMRRFTAMPLTASIMLNGISLRVETDIPAVFEDAQRFPAAGQESLASQISCTISNDTPACVLPFSSASRGGLCYRFIPGAACILVDRSAARLVTFVDQRHAARPGFLRDLLQLCGPPL